MIVTKDINLRDHEPWSGAVSTMKHLTYEQMNHLEFILDELYPDGMTETQLNDILWFETDWIAEMLGYADWEALLDDEEDE